ncbi:flagella basal body P-ring formation protein FlgA, putative [Novosphingobium sp. Rr 2-17]|uniref:flagellar basal body P-ring formation chaperone FlgA n=1 Tax=Novosphingobium sp. Rr 2-17 TaxID=555793 RepID=UPI0002699543|nr:flagellar basal body P-ring formation chaperone FlgA [Novosphingobium sp. Rr 2-17]EIZ78734.1 flagella basal body P-ring formation protein FlgA, putative [Novosphingobium sp. Rr 2-17]
MRLTIARLLLTLAFAPAAAWAQAVPPAEATLTVPVLDHAVAKGDLLAAGDFTTQELPLAQARAAPRLKDMVGMEAARALSAGAILRSSDLIRPQLVRRGEPVTITLRDGGLAITTAGRALGSGAAGDFVRIVSLSTNRTLDGVVESTGIVRVAPR